VFFITPENTIVTLVRERATTRGQPQDYAMPKKLIAFSF
jgi:hypothetical protein